MNGNSAGMNENGGRKKPKQLAYPTLGERLGFAGTGGGLPSLEGLFYLCLQLSQLLERAFSEQCEIPRILGQDLIAVRFENALHPPHLFDRLVELLRGLNHSVILKIPFFAPGSCLTC